MRAIIFNDDLRYVEDYAKPEIQPGWSLIKVRKAGICGTDLEITKGYMGYKGVLGHEFVGTVETSEDPDWTGKRVVGEINAACGVCGWCAERLGRHCPRRSVLGILNLDGCMADYCTLPTANLRALPDTVTDEQAVLTEPLAAACEIQEQIELNGKEKVVVIGDGRLGILCAWVLSTVAEDITLLGHHREKLAKASWNHLKTLTDIRPLKNDADIVVEASGSSLGISDALSLCRPRGTIVLKSTIADYNEMNLAPAVINEITIIGSRCGQFDHAIRLFQAYPDMPLERLITAEYSPEQATDAFARALSRDSLKIVLNFRKS